MTSVLSGWGLVPRTACDVRRPETREALTGALDGHPPRGTIARGLGRSYGDAAQNAGGAVLDMTQVAGVGRVQPDGQVTLAAGTSLAHVMETVLPQGWFVPVTPGTRHVTVGGAIAADIHGKNHHVDGSFGDHVHSMELLLADRSVRTVTPDGDGAELFWATIGGMGLTGVVLSAVVQLVPVTSDRMLVDTDRVDSLAELLALMDDEDDRYRYSVAWIDVLATGKSLGRGVLTRGDHAPETVSDQPARHRRGPRLRVPFPPPGQPLRRSTIRALNEAKFRSSPRRRRNEPVSISSFFHPLDGIEGWNLLYGRRGFIQYQFVVPPAAVDVVRSTVEEFATSSTPSFLAVLKRMGPRNRGLLSFPDEGWTLALDIPTGSPGLAERLQALDQVVLEAGGRVYLAKDARLGPAAFEAMYPSAAAFRDLRRRVDPDGVLASDLGRRLGLL